MINRVIFSSIIVFFFGQTPYSQIVGKEIILQSVDNGLLLSTMQESGELIYDLDNIPGSQFILEAKKLIDKSIEDGNFPVIPKGSKTEENLPEIFKSVLSQSGFTHGVFQYPDKMDLFGYIPDKISLEYALVVSHAILIEKIIPTVDDISIIEEQILELKKSMINMIEVNFPSLSMEITDDPIDLSFKRFELGPRSVMTVWGKNILADEQLNRIKNKWEISFQEEKSNFNELNTKFSKGEIPIEKIRSKWLQFIHKLSSDISGEYRKLLPPFFQNPPEIPQRVEELQSMYSASIDLLSK
jgi:hypothetical protein